MMSVKEINSKQNKTIKWIKKLQQKSKFRRDEGLYIVEGYKQIRELSKDRIHLIVFSKTEDLKVFSHLINESCFKVSREIFKEISREQTPQGIMALVYMNHHELRMADIKSQGIYLALDSIQDPGNLGTMIRVCDAVGADGLILNSLTVDLYNPKVVNSSMGSLEHIKCFLVDDMVETLSMLRDKGVVTYGAYLDDSKFHYDYDYRKGTCFVIGNEGNGISDEVIKAVSHKVKIPMPGHSESLNAAIASSVLLYEVVRQRR